MKVTKTRAKLALGALLLAGIVPAAAQEPAGAASSSAAVPAQSATAAVPTGTRLRITVLPPGRQVSGTLASTTATGVTMNLDRGGMVTIPHATVRRYERDNGRSRKRGVLLGLLAGGVAGSLIGLSSGNSCTSQGGLGSLGCLGEPAASAAGGLLIGSGIGAAVGALLPPRQRWTTLRNPVGSSGTP